MMTSNPSSDTLIEKKMETHSSQPKVRHEWFQTPTHVNISVFIKNLKKEVVQVDFTSRTLSVHIQLPHSDFCLDFDPLFQEIDPSASSFEVLSTKVEINCKKQVPGIQWTGLEGVDQPTVTNQMSVAQEQKPTYPSSSKNKKNWDEVSKQVEEDKPEGEQALNALFQQIYANASDETRKAMIKSFTESNGTCLSTNWDEVGKKKVEVTPPDGMMAKKFEK